VRDGFINKVAPEIIAHPANCRLMKHSENNFKNYNSSITIDESNGNLCLISDEKFKLDNGNLIWNSQEYNCKMKISNVTKDTIDIATNGDECFSYCGMNAFIIEGKFKKIKLVKLHNKLHKIKI
jgi:hypothetical protein